MRCLADSLPPAGGARPGRAGAHASHARGSCEGGARGGTMGSSALEGVEVGVAVRDDDLLGPHGPIVALQRGDRVDLDERAGR